MRQKIYCAYPSSEHAVSRTAPIDLSNAIQTGFEAYEELRNYYPEIPNRKPRYARGKAASDYWYVIFDLGFDIRLLAMDYMNETDPDNYDMYWKYIYDFQKEANRIVKPYSTDLLNVSVSWMDLTDTTNYRHLGRGKFEAHATMIIFDHSAPVTRK